MVQKAPFISTGKDTYCWTIEPTCGAPGRSVVDPIDESLCICCHACFRGSRAPHVQIMTSIRTIVHVESPYMKLTRENIRAVLNRADGASERYTKRYEHGR